jgi:hypothetical protein
MLLLPGQRVRVMARRTIPRDELVKQRRLVQALLLPEARELPADLVDVVPVAVIQVLLQVLRAGLRARLLLLMPACPEASSPARRCPVGLFAICCRTAGVRPASEYACVRRGAAVFSAPRSVCDAVDCAALCRP